MRIEVAITEDNGRLHTHDFESYQELRDFLSSPADVDEILSELPEEELPSERNKANRLISWLTK